MSGAKTPDEVIDVEFWESSFESNDTGYDGLRGPIEAKNGQEVAKHQEGPSTKTVLTTGAALLGLYALFKYLEK